MTTHAEWEAELLRLRESLGPLRTMRMRWHRLRRRDWSFNLIELLTVGIRSDAELWISLYEESASAGARPVVEVQVADDDAVEPIPQGTLIQVAGIPQPGHAVVVLAGQLVMWPVYPASMRVRPPRL